MSDLHVFWEVRHFATCTVLYVFGQTWCLDTVGTTVFVCCLSALFDGVSLILLQTDLFCNQRPKVRFKLIGNSDSSLRGTGFLFGPSMTCLPWSKFHFLVCVMERIPESLHFMEIFFDTLFILFSSIFSRPVSYYLHQESISFDILIIISIVSFWIMCRLIMSNFEGM